MHDKLHTENTILFSFLFHYYSQTHVCDLLLLQYFNFFKK